MNNETIEALKQVIKTFEGMEVDFHDMLKHPENEQDKKETHTGFRSIFGSESFFIKGDWATFLSGSRSYQSSHKSALIGSMNILQNPKINEPRILIKNIQNVINAGKKVLKDLEKEGKAA